MSVLQLALPFLQLTLSVLQPTVSVEVCFALLSSFFPTLRKFLLKSPPICNAFPAVPRCVAACLWGLSLCFSDKIPLSLDFSFLWFGLFRNKCLLCAVFRKKHDILFAQSLLELRPRKSRKEHIETTYMEFAPMRGFPHSMLGLSQA